MTIVDKEVSEIDVTFHIDTKANLQMQHVVVDANTNLTNTSVFQQFLWFEISFKNTNLFTCSCAMRKLQTFKPSGMPSLCKSNMAQ